MQNSTVIRYKNKLLLRMKLFKQNLRSGRTGMSLLLSICKYVLLIGIAFIIIFPFFTKLSSALMSVTDLNDRTVKYIPKDPTFENIKTVLLYSDYGKALFNTFWISIVNASIQLFISSFVAYGLAKFRFRGRGVIFAFIILTLIIPSVATTTPEYISFKNFDLFGLFRLITGEPLNLIGTPIPVFILSLFGLGFKSGIYVFLLRQCFAGMPKELNEAAYVDGAGIMRTYFTIMVPLAKPIMITSFLLSFSWSWTDTTYSSIFYGDLTVLPNILSSVQALVGMNDYGKTMISSVYVNCASLLVILPLIIFYIFAQRYIIGGIEKSGIVG